MSGYYGDIRRNNGELNGKEHGKSNGKWDRIGFSQKMEYPTVSILRFILGPPLLRQTRLDFLLSNKGEIGFQGLGFGVSGFNVRV